MTQRKSLDLLSVSERARSRRGEEWSAAGSHVQSDWLGFSLKGLLCILQKGFK